MSLDPQRWGEIRGKFGVRVLGRREEGCRTRTLCREEGPPRWPPSSRESWPPVLISEPARDSHSWKITLWKVAAERQTEYDSLSLQSAGPNEIHLAVVSTLLNNLLREPVSRDWPLVCLELLGRCPDTEDRQETTDIAAREIPEGVARLSAPLCFRVERTERGTRGRPRRRRPRFFRALSTSVPLRGSTRGNAVPLDLPIWGAGTRLGLLPPSSP